MTLTNDQKILVVAGIAILAFFIGGIGLFINMTRTGPIGPQGIAGESIVGLQGIAGENGNDGIDGADGFDGTDGVNGTNGINGVDGEVGPQGPAGIAAEAGSVDVVVDVNADANADVETQLLLDATYAAIIAGNALELIDLANANLDAAETALEVPLEGDAFADAVAARDKAIIELGEAQNIYDTAVAIIDDVQEKLEELDLANADVEVSTDTEVEATDVETNTEADAEVEVQTDTEVEVLITELFSANIPSEIVAQKVNPNGCDLPSSEGCNVLNESGVLGADFLAEANANDSAVWTGSAWHQMAQTAEVGTIVPEGSYLTAYAASFTVSGGGYEIEIPNCGELCAQGFLARGLNAQDSKDLNIAVTISDYGAVGAMTYTVYAVPVDAAEFFSYDYATDQAINAINTNCGAGPDCEKFIQHLFDYNDGSYTVYSFTAANGWELLFSNIVE